jgi:hypothetical protein
MPLRAPVLHRTVTRLPPLPLVMVTKADVPNVNGHVFTRPVLDRIVQELNAEPKQVRYGFNPDSPTIGESVVRTAKVIEGGLIAVTIVLIDPLAHGRAVTGDLVMGGQYRADVGPDNVVVPPPAGTPMVQWLGLFKP